ncbi:MAG: DUF4188 domain-containing protein [Acidimicrobiia bacterium]|jgi:hypothetical protein|nr:DUF4188 domain-containing protein [Acidimicrobiia bacterium]
MAKVVPGRHTAEIDGDFVVFIIGARVNKKRRLVTALRAIGGMQKMLKYLSGHPDKGLLGYETAGFTIIQYWRSFEDLERFAKDADDPHLEVWRRYMRMVNKTGEAGIWHETYLVRAGEYEAIYNNMPERGLAAASRLVPVAESSRARGRVGAKK